MMQGSGVDLKGQQSCGIWDPRKSKYQLSTVGQNAYTGEFLWTLRLSRLPDESRGYSRLSKLLTRLVKATSSFLAATGQNLLMFLPS